VGFLPWHHFDFVEDLGQVATGVGLPALVQLLLVLRFDLVPAHTTCAALGSKVLGL
jgi:hypothetical protein